MINGKERELITKQTRYDVERLIRKHIDRFNNLLYNVQISRDLFSFRHKKVFKKIKTLTELIENELYNLCLTRALYKLEEKEDKDSIIAYINSDRPNGGLSESISKYVSVLNGEIEAYIESSLFFDISISEGLKELKQGLKNAYSTGFIRKAYKEIENPNSIILKAKGLKVKNGEYKTSNANLKRLIGFMVIDAITYRQINYYEQEGAIGYEVHRGSSYPCDYCDSFLGFHPIDDTSALPPQHGNCYCYITPAFKEI